MGWDKFGSTPWWLFEEARLVAGFFNLFSLQILLVERFL